METNRSETLHTLESGLDINLYLDQDRLPHGLLRRQDLPRVLESARKIDQSTLINTLNYIHFVEGTILVHLYHPGFGESLLLRADPKPCYGKHFSGYWSNGNFAGLDPERCEFLHLIIEDGKCMILAPATLHAISRDAFAVQLPATSYAIERRQTRRHVCRGVMARLSQEGFEASAELLDFNPLGFRVRLEPESSRSFRLFDLDEPITVYLSRDQQIFYSGLCRCVRHSGGGLAPEVVMASEVHQINRFKRRVVRNPRQQLSSAASITFEHPFLKKRVELEINDISTSGFSVYERSDEEMLMPGMIIPNVSIHYAGIVGMTCTAQVIYRLKEEGKNIRCGLAILDMDVYSFSRLAHIIANILDSGAHISTDLDVNELWRFFFESGFISPSKYGRIYTDRESFKAIYRKLYLENPEIARHFIYKRKGVICGHISMVRGYERAWIIHHHAARTVDSRRSGFQVLRQLIHYVNDMHRLPSLNADFVFSYFRSENAFPDAVFGGFARDVNDDKLCSMDLFSYSPFSTFARSSRVVRLETEWSLHDCSGEEFHELNRFYSDRSGGLMLDAFGLGQERTDGESLTDVYARLGFMRRLSKYALTREGELKAVLVVDLSEQAFNLSGLLHCIKVLVTDSGGLQFDTIRRAISILAGKFGLDEFPVLIYPFDYVDENQVPYERRYQLWILNLKGGGGDAFMEFMQRKFRACYGSARKSPPG